MDHLDLIISASYVAWSVAFLLCYVLLWVPSMTPAVAPDGPSAAAVSTASANGLRPGEWITALMRDYRSYHHTKEIQQWAAIAALVAGTMWFLGLEPIRLDPFRAAAAAAAGVALVAGIGWQNKNRRAAAAMFEACLNVSVCWLARDPLVGDLAAEQAPAPFGKGIVLPHAVVTEFIKRRDAQRISPFEVAGSVAVVSCILSVFGRLLAVASWTLAKW